MNAKQLYRKAYSLHRACHRFPLPHHLHSEPDKLRREFMALADSSPTAHQACRAALITSHLVWLENLKST